MLWKYFLIIDRCAANYRQLYPAPFNLTKFLSGQNEIWFCSAASTGGAKRDEAGFVCCFWKLGGVEGKKLLCLRHRPGVHLCVSQCRLRFVCKL